MPDPVLGNLLSRVRTRWQLRSIAMATAIGGAVFALTWLLGLFIFEAPRPAALWFALLSGVAALLWMTLTTRRLSAIDAAKAIERASGSLDNLVITAAELGERPREISAEIRGEIDRQTADRLRAVQVDQVVPLAQPVTIAIAVIAGCVLLGGIGADSIAARAAVIGITQPDAIGATSFKVEDFPPAYTRRKAEELTDPVQISLVGGQPRSDRHRARHVSRLGGRVV